MQRIVNDEDLDFATAKERHIETTLDALTTEFGREGLQDYQIDELLNHLNRCVLINKNDLQLFTIQDATQWPDTPGQNEICERQLLRELGKLGTTTS